MILETQRRLALASAVAVAGVISVFTPEPAGQGGLKVLLLYDMEGVTGATKPQDVSSSSDSYPATRESLTADVNAAIAGLQGKLPSRAERTFEPTGKEIPRPFGKHGYR